MVSVGDKALLFRNQDMMWLEESGSPSVGDKGFLVRTEDGNFFLKGTSVSVGNKGRLFNINNQYYLRSAISELGKFKWRVNCSSNVHGIKVTSDGTIYAGTEWTATGGAVWGINSDGDTKWCNNDTHHPTDYPNYYTDIAISSDETKLYIGDTGAYLRCFNTLNGTEIWNWSEPTSAVGFDFWGGIVIDNDDNIYGGGRYGIVSVDKDGNFRWGNSTVGETDYHLAVDNDQLYSSEVPYNISNQNLSLKYGALDSYSGVINWVAGIDEGYTVKLYNDRIYYGTTDGIDKTTSGGGLIYRYSVPDDFANAYVEDIVIDSNENCYFLGYRGGYPNYSTYIRKLDSDGNLIWTKNMTNGHCAFFGSHAMAIDSDTLYVATNTWGASPGAIAAFGIDLSNGNTNMSYIIPYDSESGGALSPSQDTYYFGSGQYLYALET